MSVHQMVCHLSDGYRVMMGERTVQLAATPMPRPIVKCVALYLPLKWPQGIPTTPEVDQEAGGTRPIDFAADVAELATLLDRAATARRDRIDGTLHPIFGRMSAPAWLRWAYLHADHHFRQFGV